MTHQNETEYGDASWNNSRQLPLCIRVPSRQPRSCRGGVHYVSTNNNTASRHKLSPGEPVDKRAVFLTAPHAPYRRSVVIIK